MRLSIPDKLPQVGTTIFTTMSVLAQQHHAINLGQGFPDFMMSDRLIALVNEAMKNGHNQYVHMNGLPALRQQLAIKANNLYGASIDPDKHITVTPGGTYAIYTALTALLEPGDEVILFEPAYDSYIPNILINGGIPVPIALQHPNYSIDWALVQSKITPQTKAIIINSPHNPTGSVLSAADMEQLEALVNNTGIFVISDEVYEHLIFDDLPHQSLLRYPALLARGVACFSFGKTFHCTGWKLGYAIAGTAIMQAFRKIHQFNAFTCNSPVQVALAEYLQDQSAYLDLGKWVQQKRDYFQKLMQGTRFTALPTHGSYFQLYSYKGLTDESDKALAIRLTQEFGVATIPASSFYTDSTDHQVLRFCFVKQDATLEQAVAKLASF